MTYRKNKQTFWQTYHELVEEVTGKLGTVQSHQKLVEEIRKELREKHGMVPSRIRDPESHSVIGPLVRDALLKNLLEKNAITEEQVRALRSYKFGAERQQVNLLDVFDCGTLALARPNGKQFDRCWSVEDDLTRPLWLQGMCFTNAPRRLHQYAEPLLVWLVAKPGGRPLFGTIDLLDNWL
jgi:hypothetical protein